MQTTVLAAILLGATSVASNVAGQTVALKPPDAEASVEFTKLVSMRELGDGSVLLVDLGVNRLFHYDWTTGTTEEIGSRGRGPLEYEHVGRVYAVGPDSTLFTDSKNGRWNLLVGARIVSTMSENRPLNRLLRSRLLGGDRHGHVLGQRRFRFSGRSRLAGADSLLLLLADWRAGTHDTIARLKGPGPAGYARLPATHERPLSIVSVSPLGSQEWPLLFPDGAIAVARLDPYRIDWRLPDGSWVHGDPLPFESRRVTRRIKCAAIQGYIPTSGPCDPDLLPGWPETVPPFLRPLTRPLVMPTPEGRLLVERAFVGLDPHRRYDVIDRRGRLAATLTLPADAFVLGLGRNAVYTVVTDEWGLQTLRRHPWD